MKCRRGVMSRTAKSHPAYFLFRTYSGPSASVPITPSSFRPLLRTPGLCTPLPLRTLLLRISPLFSGYSGVSPRHMARPCSWYFPPFRTILDFSTSWSSDYVLVSSVDTPTTFRTTPLYSVALDTGLVLRTYIGRLDSIPVHYLNLFKSSLHTPLDSSSTIRSESSLRIASHSALRSPTPASLCEAPAASAPERHSHIRNTSPRPRNTTGLFATL